MYRENETPCAIPTQRVQQHSLIRVWMFRYLYWYTVFRWMFYATFARCILESFQDLEGLVNGMTNVDTITSKQFNGAPHEFFNSKYLLQKILIYSSDFRFSSASPLAYQIYFVELMLELDQTSNQRTEIRTFDMSPCMLL